MRYGKCAVDGCDRNKIVARGLCSLHYHRWQRHGDPTAGRTQDGEPLKWVKEVALNYDDDKCLAWPFSVSSNGYGKIYVDGLLRVASRYICECVNGGPPTSDHEAAHSCGKGHEGCVNPNHLSWKTSAENHFDKLVHGTHVYGEKHGSSKLTEINVLDIRSLYEEGVAPKEIAARYGISYSSVSDIVNRRTWARLG